MATIDELNLTPYQRIMARMTPTMNPYMGAGQVMGGYDPELYRRMSGSGLINLGVGGGGVIDSGGGGSDSGGGAPPPGRSGPNVSFGPDNFMVANNVNPNMVSGITGLLGLLTGIPGLGFLGRELANRSNFTNEQAAMFGNVGLRDTTDPSNLSGLIGPTATTGPTGTGGQASSAAASAAAAASAMGYSNEAIGAASQAAANAAIGGASAADAAALGSAAAQTVANDIDAVSATQGIGVNPPSQNFYDALINAFENPPITPNEFTLVAGPNEVALEALTGLTPAPDGTYGFTGDDSMDFGGPEGGSVGADYGGPADGGYGGSPADADSGAGGYGGDSGGGSDSSGGDGGGGGGDGGGGDGGGDSGYAQGGLIKMLFGPNPAGPDDGAGYLQLGEYVIKKSAVKKYGQGLLDMINDGKIPAKKMKSLLA